MTFKLLAIPVKNTSRSSKESDERTCHLCVEYVDCVDSIVMEYEEYRFGKVCEELVRMFVRVLIEELLECFTQVFIWTWS